MSKTFHGKYDQVGYWPFAAQQGHWHPWLALNASSESKINREKFNSINQKVLLTVSTHD
jgi:hypothetical protein